MQRIIKKRLRTIRRYNKSNKFYMMKSLRSIFAAAAVALVAMPSMAVSLSEMDPNDDVNLLKDANITLESTWFANNDWQELSPQPAVEVKDGAVSLTLPEGMGPQQWQGQVKLLTGITLSADVTYNFRCTVDASEALPFLVVKPVKVGDDGVYLTDKRNENLPAGESQVRAKNCAGFDGELMIVLDFGGDKAGTKVTVKDFIVYDNSQEPGGTGVAALDVENAAPVYFNLQGVKVANPENGVYIVKRGNKVSKEVVRK